ncbi:MAG: TonB-dependent receptor [Marinomonas sp.]
MLKQKLWRQHFSLILGLFVSVLAQADMFSLDEYDTFSDSIPVVVTPSKISQPRADVSSSLSVLDGDFIRRINMQYVEDLLQFVPGFTVASYTSSSQKSASYHGTEYSGYRRIQVLVNGRSVYSAGLARVEWSMLPLNIEDVARVEVNRGPNAASYGLNSFFAVVNIITRSPLETLGNSISAYAGTQGDYRLYGQHSGLNGNWSYRASASTNSVEGYDTDFYGDERNDGHRSEMGNVFIQHETSTSVFDVDIGASYVNGNVDKVDYAFDLGGSEYLGGYDSANPTNEVEREHIKFGFAKQVASNHELKLQYYYDQSDANEQHDVVLYDFFYDVIFGGVTDLSTLDLSSTDSVDKSFVVDLRETRHDIELQSTLTSSDKLRVISALGYRYDEVESEHYFGGTVNDEITRLSSNMEYRASKNWVINTGAMLEHSKMAGTFLSPKFGATYKLSEHESIRMNASRAVRTPDLSDQYFNWRYVLTTGESSSATYAEEGEEEEIVTSYEIGYFHYWPSQDLSFDVRLYHDEVEGLVLSRKHFTGFLEDTPVEEGVTEDIDINGIEVELDWRFDSGAMTRFTYAYQDTHTESKRLLETTPPILMSFFYSLPLNEKWSYQGYYWYGKELANKDYEFFNTWLSYQTSLGGYSKATVGIGLETRLDNNSLISRHNNYDEDSYAYVFTNITF